jgi:putative DNA primase/helicase
MRQDFFTYQPQFKIFLIGNHKPSLKSVDQAIRRRFNLIPFTVKIAPEELDVDLPEKLKEEWPGILQWMIYGCSGWRNEGLNPPRAVYDATDIYLAEEDSLAQWLKERTRKIGYNTTQTGVLFEDWTKWATAAGERPGSMKKFSQGLQGKGYKSCQDSVSRRSAFEGIALADVQTHRSDR